MSRILRLAAVGLAAAVLLAACGNDVTEGGNTYVDRVNAAQKRFATTVETLSGKITPKSTASSDRRTLQGYQTAVDKVVGDLERISPPDSVRTEHQQLIAIMDGYGGDVRKATDAILARDPQDVQRAQRTLTTAAAGVAGRINATIEAINRKLGD